MGRKKLTEPKTAAEILKKPVRMRILGWLAGQSKPQTKREIGRALSLSNASVHYHIKLLEQASLVKFEGTRPGPNTIIEKLYSAQPLTSKNQSMTVKEKDDFYLSYTLDAISEAQREGQEIAQSDPDNARFIVASYETYATEKEIVALKKKVDSTLKNFFDTHKKKKKDTTPLSVTFTLLPSNAAGWDTSSRIRVFDTLT